MLFCDGRKLKYGQIDLLCSHKKNSECEIDTKFAFVNEFSAAGKNLLQDTQTGGTCFHIVSLMEAPIKRKIVPLQNILGK